jgi:hypothetical protein
METLANFDQKGVLPDIQPKLRLHGGANLRNSESRLSPESD